eukprot:CAMPEP_0170635600 /NCGR_PEP_ID=MMETSP0224-20130122/37310_1 /TAXON_ID=285029 /ORGANISM="Togula jolla, Strain CCCM 725" /LENGTH=576 /DNA_ID=CAMNT_0010965115 /DNA_START=161 /DNA_END=1891 /DNA_ORIENTATION=+
MADFAPVKVVSNPDGWGPPLGADLDMNLLDFQVEHLDKFPLTRIGRVCDFSAQGQRFQQQRIEKGKGKGKGGQTLAPVPGKDEEGFALVDTRPNLNKPAGKGKSKGKGKSIATNYQEGILGQKQKQYFQTGPQKGKGKGKIKGRGKNTEPSFKEWSVAVKTDWTVIREIMLSQLSKSQIDSREVATEDMVWCGVLHDYNKEFDRLSTKTEKTMRRFEDLNFFNVTTTDDPKLPDFLQSDPTVSVIATDHVLACLVAATRSVYSWDIVVQKIQNKLIFDKRDGSQIDFLSVNETAREPPSNDDKDSMNSTVRLSHEASCINQNFSQMVLDNRSEPEQMEQENPFEEEGEGRAASGAYRYRKFILPGNPKAPEEFDQQPVSLIVRTEVNCKMPGKEASLVSVKALNEYDPKVTYSWRTHLDTQRGMVLGTELKNNGFKLGRWTAQAILAGCDIMKIGYVSRVRASDPWTHTVLGVQTYYTDGFAEQIGMNRNNVFGILRSFIDLIMGCEDGKYVIMKDPTKSMLRVYQVPWDAFGEDDADDGGEEEEEEGEELDEDGRPVPAHVVGSAILPPRPLIQR